MRDARAACSQPVEAFCLHMLHAGNSRLADKAMGKTGVTPVITTSVNDDVSTPSCAQRGRINVFRTALTAHKCEKHRFDCYHLPYLLLPWSATSLQSRSSPDCGKELQRTAWLHHARRERACSLAALSSLTV